MTPRQSIAAGAAIGAAQDMGLDQTQQATAAILAARKVADDEAHKLSDTPKSRMPTDSLDISRPEPAKTKLDPLPEQDRPHRRHRPQRAQQEGFLLKLAHWLNLK